MATAQSLVLQATSMVLSSADRSRVVCILATLAMITGIGCRSDANPTTVGTQLIDWKRGPDTSMTSIRVGDDVGASSTAHKRVTIQPNQGGFLDPNFQEILIAVDLEHGSAELLGDAGDTPAAVAAPRHILATLEQNDHWGIDTECDDRISVPLSVDGEGRGVMPDVVYQVCRFTLRRDDYDARVTVLELYGDGTVNASHAFGTVTIDDHEE